MKVLKENCKYFLEETIKNRLFGRTMESNMDMVNMCMDEVDDDDNYILKLRDLLVDSGEVLKLEDKEVSSLLYYMFNSANYAALEQLKELTFHDYSQKAIDDIISLLKKETREEVYKLSSLIYKNAVDKNIKDSKRTLEVFECMHKSHCELINDILKIKNEEEYDKVVKTLFKK